ncbi:TetR/AcrR family transcriptional regulator [Streptomyces sp. NBC_00285]|uniref:TetR/AcrR family transcriptional regulator n=1 Tax=Streptomyces sp. NBC_00285 TaxID=2975700 RepID=UPI002E2DC58D|nr:helix-turn-helix domain-containing protein [Streptomyces sp. NBC_00285]
MLAPTRAGVSPPAVYLHFASKRELVHATCLRVCSSLLIRQDRDAWPPDRDRYVRRAASSAVHGALLTASHTSGPSPADVTQLARPPRRIECFGIPGESCEKY